ncbi:MAG: response regulator [Roseobacter sp.]|jgi:CheY-like chemotaxis protein|nr:response regulator [Roseobacter sp.]
MEPLSVHSERSLLHECQPFRVLLLDDNRFDRVRIRRFCSQIALPIELEEAATLDAFAGKLSDQVFDLYILDCRLPLGSGFDALRLVQSRLGVSGGVVMTSAIHPAHNELTELRSESVLFCAKSQLTSHILYSVLWMSRQRRLKLLWETGGSCLNRPFDGRRADDGTTAAVPLQCRNDACARGFFLPEPSETACQHTRLARAIQRLGRARLQQAA